MGDLVSKNGKAVATGIVNRFALNSPARSVESHGNGLVNATFRLITEDSGYILQRINERVFPNAERIVSNLSLLEGHLAARADTGLRIPALIPAKDGLPFVRDGDGGTWRLMELVPDTRVLSRIGDLEQAREVGRILGRFHALVSDLPASRLAVTLPGFHVTPAYLQRFRQILAECTSVQREEISHFIAFAAARQTQAGVLEEARQQGRIPMRVVHGDPKLDNILFDRTTCRAVSLIDLDTVQPGLVHYDLGDCLRSCCNQGGEFAAGADARFDLDLCHAILGTYADETKGLLRTAEIDLLFDAIRLIPFELGLRFLTDHLEGDRYFRVAERGENLRKASVQFALVEDIEGKEQDLRRIIAECFHSAEKLP
jgi:Ser/Thr protein kinase RdoA (MazF antagonist)